MPALNTKNAISTYTSIDSTTDPVELAAENGSRVGLIIYNNSSANLKVLVGKVDEADTEMTANDFSFIIAANSVYVMPYEYTTVKFTGIWASVNGNAKVTEISDR